MRGFSIGLSFNDEWWRFWGAVVDGTYSKAFLLASVKALMLDFTDVSEHQQYY